jgi:thymidylate synthase ThyX
MNVHDTPLREFERAHFFFETEISAAAYAQLKRHRMLSLYRLPETADLGCVVPALVQAVSATDAYEKQYAHARELYRTTLQEVGVGAAGYVLPLSTVTRVQFETNMREAYHMSRMREDAHAQWEIREMMIDASNHIRTVAPLSSMLLGGKHEFPDIYASAFETVNP